MDANPEKRVKFLYTNYEGKVGVREVTLSGTIRFGATEWHPTPGWLISGYDHEKGADREFALVDADFRTITLEDSGDWRIRVVEEKRALDEKINRLEQFLDRKDADQAVGLDMYRDLSEQYAIMTAYSDTLARRLSLEE